MKTFKISELGCKVNQYESQLMREQLASVGLIEESGGRPADLYVINTCTVTSSADFASRNFLRRALRQNPNARIAVAGCYAEKDADEIKKIYSEAIIIKNIQKNNIIDAIGCDGVSGRNSRDAEGISYFSAHNRAFVKIQDGCNNGCSYCKVPLVRGRARSRDIGDILKEAVNLAKAGFKEIVLCGICLGAYNDLAGLLDKLEPIAGLERIRLSSIEPGCVTNELIDKINSSEKICRHLHIPLQSGDNGILKLMNRNYTVGQYVDLVKNIRSRIPDIAIATDVIAGFPGETEREFKNTLKAIEAVKPMRAHIFSFSKREGTGAFSMPGQVEKARIRSRIKILAELTKEMSLSYRKKMQGNVFKVLVESGRDKKTNLFTGYTDTYVKVLFQTSVEKVNELIRVRITEVLPDCTVGSAL